MADTLQKNLTELYDLIIKLNDDLNDPKIVTNWLTFITCPRIETTVFCMAEFLENKLSLPKLQEIVDLAADTKALVVDDDDGELELVSSSHFFEEVNDIKALLSEIRRMIVEKQEVIFQEKLTKTSDESVEKQKALDESVDKVISKLKEMDLENKKILYNLSNRDAKGLATNRMHINIHNTLSEQFLKLLARM